MKSFDAFDKIMGKFARQAIVLTSWWVTLMKRHEPDHDTSDIEALLVKLKNALDDMK